MTELEDIKDEIAVTMAKLKEATEEAKKSLDFTRRDRLEGLLLEQQRTLNLLLARSGN
jgi:predicted transcriptional regulator